MNRSIHPAAKLMLYIVQNQKSVKFNAMGMCQFCCSTCQYYIRYMQYHNNLRPFLTRGYSFDPLPDWFLPFPCQATVAQDNKQLRFFIGDATATLFFAIKGYLEAKGMRKSELDMKLMAESGLTREEIESLPRYK